MAFKSVSAGLLLVFLFLASTLTALGRGLFWWSAKMGG